MFFKNNHKSYHYNDILLFLIIIPIISAYNYYLTYANIQYNWYTLLTFTIDTLQGYAAWWSVRAIILYLDQKMPYAVNTLQRILVQIIITTAIGLIIIIFLTELVNAIAKDTPVHPSFYRFDIFIFIIWFLVINGIYIGMYYASVLRQLEKTRQEAQKVLVEGFPVKQGKQHLSIAFNEIIGFYVDGDYTILITNQNKKYLLDQSLDKIEKNLPADYFFRLNRQFILNRQIIKGFNKIENGKLNALLQSSDYFPEMVQVSRLKAPAFKTWLQLNVKNEI
ncbi:MAG: LytR/AlgR family response regulator transcription factor [Saprospiraceae bacterium]